MLSTLRAFAGEMRNVPIIVVQFRSGPGLSRETLFELERLDAQFVTAPQTAKKPAWLTYSNRIVSITTADHIADTDTITSLDSDIIISSDPLGVLAAPAEICARYDPFLRLD